MGKHEIDMNVNVPEHGLDLLLFHCLQIATSRAGLSRMAVDGYHKAESR